MSFRRMLKHRCTILRQDVDLTSGSPVYDWVEVKTGVRCFLDLNFIRSGKDAVWTPESGRGTERYGVGFFLGTEPLKPGDWIKMTRGPTGVFSLEAAVDEAWRPEENHHLEIGCKEVPKQYTKGQLGASFDPAASPVPLPGATTTTTTTAAP